MCAASLANRRSGVKGRWAKRTPVALASALETAGATGLMPHSPWDLAPSGPIVSIVSAKKMSVCGVSAKAGTRQLRSCGFTMWPSSWTMFSISAQP